MSHQRFHFHSAGAHVSPHGKLAVAPGIQCSCETRSSTFARTQGCQTILPNSCTTALPFSNHRLRKQTKSRNAMDVPFLHLQIWVARVIDEAREVALACSINNLVLIEGHEVHVVKSRHLLLASLPAVIVNHLP